MRRRRLVPEVLQTFAMDCGPAALTALLRGHGIDVAFDRLRAACQTSIDGTSIDDLEAVAADLGLEVEQILVPPDHALDPRTRCLPSLAVTQDPSGALHFVVLWSRLGPWVQVMDPRRGRRWLRAEAVAQALYVHSAEVPAARWEAFARSAAFRGRLQQRASAVGVRVGDDPAALDGALRFASALVAAGALRRREQAAVVDALVRAPDDIPAPERFALPDGDAVLLQGVVLLRVVGRRRGAVPASAVRAAGWTEPRPPLARSLWRLVADRAAVPIMAAAVAFAGFTTLIEAVLLRGWLDLLHLLGAPADRAVAAAALATFLAAQLLLGLPVTALSLRAGRQLELRLRAAFLRKLPRLSEAYLTSRPTSDWAERSHAIHAIRGLPGTLRAIAGNACRMAAVVLGIAWLSPWSAPLALLVAALSVGIPLAVHRTHQERDLRARTQGGALARFSLDAMLGLVPVRTHGAERTVRDEHEALLAEWARSTLAVHRWIAGAAGVQILVGLGLAAALLVVHVDPSGDLRSDAGATLLLVYWALLLPTYGELLAAALRQLPHPASVAVRLLEPLAAPEVPLAAPAPTPEGGAALAFEGVSVTLGGQPVLRDVSFAVGAGEHVAVVGASGAGKSTVVAAILGLVEPGAGRILADGAPLDPPVLAALRERCAWVDPAVQLWNASMLANLRYGVAAGAGAPVGDCVEQAELLHVVEQLPDGMRTSLGEGGARLSGGEGNRVRYGRALGRPDVRLVLLDEAFRGLDRWSRTTLLARARAQFAGATVVCVTHDVADTATFHRVLVFDGGELVQDGPPDALAAEEGPYRALLDKEAQVREQWWGFSGWRRWWIERGALREEGR
ncbi:MAG: ATP-binding cassette domain-containing protein [Myxococcota bacterium]